MPHREIDPALAGQVAGILASSREPIGDWEGWTLAPITNSFQDKQNVYRIQSPGPEALILKLERAAPEVTIHKEAAVLQYLSRLDVPVPRLVGSGVCEGDRYLLMEAVEGVPLNWVYYEAAIEERRVYLRQVVDLVSRLSSIRVCQPPGAPCLGGIAGGLRDTDGGVGCEALAPFNDERVGPFSSVDEMYQARIGFWLDRLRARRERDADLLLEAWSRLDRSVLSGDVSACLAHADIAPMNLIVDPETRSIKGLIDWEFAGFYPVDMDFHSLLYFDRHQQWKWCGADDVALAGALMEELGIARPDGYAERLPWFDLLQLARDLCQYQGWFSDADALNHYEASLKKRLDAFFAACGMKPAG